MEETLDCQEHYLLKKDGRFLVAALQTPHQVLSTSACSGGMTGGMTGGVRFLVNHQSVEGQGHLDRFEWMTEIGETGYHRHVCEELGLEPEAVAMMGTAANMNYAARVVVTFAELRVCAVVTMTEGKSAALRDLAVSSRYSRDLATGTGTDQYCIAAPRTRASAGAGRGWTTCSISFPPGSPGCC